MRTGPGRSVRASVAAAILAALAVAAAPPARAGTSPEAEANEECIECHKEEDRKLHFANGTDLPVKLDEKAWAASVHGGRLRCTGCHRDVTSYPHEERKQAPSAREYGLLRAEACARCHYAHYTRALDGIHYAALERGNREAPTCVDCHGSHEIKPAATPRVSINERCSRCHEKIADTFRRSVHGRALVDGKDQDVPVCTDCHSAHATENPKTSRFRAGAHELCQPCHADPVRMARHGLNPGVLTTYLEDFHGVSNRLYVASGDGAAKKPMATCTDCHGVHDIASMKARGETVAVKDRVVQVCRRCHQAAPVAFADAWLGHYEPTLDRAPLVWAISWAYRILIPAIILGLVLHVLLHLWRVRVHHPRSET